MYASIDEQDSLLMSTEPMADAAPAPAVSPLIRHLRIAMRFAQLVPLLPMLLTVLVSGFKGTPLPFVLLASALLGSFLALQVCERLMSTHSVLARMIVALIAAVLVAQVVTYLSASWVLHSDYRNTFEIPPDFPRDQVLARLGAGPALVMGAAAGLMQFGLWAAFGMLPEVLERERTRKLELERLVLEATHLRTRAEIVRLRSQLEPHFLLNTLNLVSGLVTQKPERARDVLVTFGDLLQDALVDHEDLHHVEQEVQWLKRYVDILEARHGDILKVAWHVEPSVFDALLPRLLLQPLLENAIQHGALCKKGGAVRVLIARQGETIQCSVIDNGPGIGGQRPKSIGLENVRGRIRVHFPDGDFELTRHGDETIARVTLPYRNRLPENQKKAAAAIGEDI
jgi:signal transduction histidine kinase